jgi:organic radical activating enzyme
MNNFVSTGKKILRHLDYLKYFQDTGIIKPISLQIAPTSRCNLNCVFCSNVNRQKHEDLDIRNLLSFIIEMQANGAKTIEWTGGGDPTQYEFIKTAIGTAYNMGYRQGFITNGIDLKKKVASYIDYLSWIRISLNSLDYIDDIEIPKNYRGTLGFSYVWNDKTIPGVFNRINQYINKYNPKYVRIVPDCQTSSEVLKERNEYLSNVVREWGSPYFYQAKSFAQPKRCWWGHFKPFLLHDSFIYPCSSVVLNDTSERSFHKKFRWMSMLEFSSIKTAVPFNCKDCTNCVFKDQNDLVESLIDSEMENFI